MRNVRKTRIYVRFQNHRPQHQQQRPPYELLRPLKFKALMSWYRNNHKLPNKVELRVKVSEYIWLGYPMFLCLEMFKMFFKNVSKKLSHNILAPIISFTFPFFVDWCTYTKSIIDIKLVCSNGSCFYSFLVFVDSNGEKRFGVVAVICLIAGLIGGLVIGVIAVLLVQRYAKR